MSFNSVIIPTVSGSPFPSPPVPTPAPTSATSPADPLPDVSPEKPDQDWRVYINKKYNYSLRYPATWELTDRLTYPEVEWSGSFAISSPGTVFLYLNMVVDDYPYSPNQRQCAELNHCIELYNQLRNSGPGWQIVSQEAVE